MKDPVLRETLRQIHDIVMEEVGQALPDAAQLRLQQVLHGAIGGAVMRTRAQDDLARDVTILVADLRGFSMITSTQSPATVLALLNRCFAEMSEMVFRHGGTIDKFMGDAMLVLFESPGDSSDGALRAVSCAVDMQLAMEALNVGNRSQGLPEMFFGIGINTGRVISALLGGELYSEYTVIGDEVNLASRIESFSLRGQVLVSQSTYERCRDFVDTGAPMDAFVKGRNQTVVLREVLGIPSLGKVVPRQEYRRSARVQVKVPLTYRMVVNQAVIPEARWGRILDIGYHGVLLEVWVPLEPFAELVLDFDLPLVGQRVNNLYGKVVKASQKGDRVHAGIEFTSMRPEQKAAIQLFVQLLIQGSENVD